MTLRQSLTILSTLKTLTRSVLLCLRKRMRLLPKRLNNSKTLRCLRKKRILRARWASLWLKSALFRTTITGSKWKTTYYRRKLNRALNRQERITTTIMRSHKKMRLRRQDSHSFLEIPEAHLMVKWLLMGLDLSKTLRLYQAQGMKLMKF